MYAVISSNATNIGTTFKGNAAENGGGIQFNAGTQFLTNVDCIFNGNKAQVEFGGAINGNSMEMFQIHNENNTFVGNTGPSGSAIQLQTSKGKTYSVTIRYDTYTGNNGSSGVVSILGKVVITMTGTEFSGNIATGSNAGIYLNDVVGRFLCQECQFYANKAKSSGVVAILQSGGFDLLSSHFENNQVESGYMVEIQSIGHGVVNSSLFVNNTSSGLSAQLSVDTKDSLHISNCTFLNHPLPTEDGSVGVSDAVVIKCNRLVMQNMIAVMEGPGHVIKTVVSDRASVMDINYTCPVNHIPETQYGYMNVTNRLPLSTGDRISGLAYSVGSVNLTCSACGKGKYNLEPSEYSLILPGKDGVKEVNTGLCHICPAGGVCDNNKITSLPNYWGFRHDNRMKFKMCQDKFCCQSEPCESFDMCGKYRSGKMCSSCRKGYQLDMFSDDCVLTEQCETNAISQAIVLSGLVYTSVIFCLLLLPTLLFSLGKHFLRPLRDYPKKDRGINLNGIDNIGHTIENESDVDIPTDKDREIARTAEEAQATSKYLGPYLNYFELFHIIVMHVQDGSLFRTVVHDKPNSLILSMGDSDRIVALAHLNPVSAFVSNPACLPGNLTHVEKLLIQTSVIPLMISFFISMYLIVQIMRLSQTSRNKIKEFLIALVSITFMFGYQQLCIMAFNLINCTWIGTGQYLYIDTTIKCFQTWHIAVFAYILLFTIPVILMLCWGPSLLQNGKISSSMFLFGLLFPLPCLLYIAWNIIIRKPPSKKLLDLNSNSKAPPLIQWLSCFSKFKMAENIPVCAWCGMVYFYRFVLVLFASLISLPYMKIPCMFILVQIYFLIQLKYQPYAREQSALRMIYSLSLFAIFTIGIIKFGWATIVYNQAGFTFGNSLLISEKLVTLEYALTYVVPPALVVCSIFHFGTRGKWE